MDQSLSAFKLNVTRCVMSQLHILFLNIKLTLFLKKGVTFSKIAVTALFSHKSPIFLHINKLRTPAYFGIKLD